MFVQPPLPLMLPESAEPSIAVRRHPVRLAEAGLLALALLTGGSAWAQVPVPVQLQGYWVPSAAACNSTLGVLVGGQRLKLKNAGQEKTFQTETCFSCEGGARYAGQVIWVLPKSEAETMQFVLYLNADERVGTARLEIQSDTLSSAFPLHQTQLKRCTK